MTNKKEEVLELLIEKLELPSLAYEKANDRYEDLGEWFNREKSLLRENNVHIFPQGSFSLGTAIRPINDDGEYDLDIACKIRNGFNKETHTQKAVKEVVGEELKLYRIAKNIHEPVTTKRRCWRLEYRDNINFHIDIVPAIPANKELKITMLEKMSSINTTREIAERASDLVMSITDDKHENYNSITNDWIISNPEGYRIWFNDQMNKGEKGIFIEKSAQVDEIPTYNRKTPLQRSIQLLKRHRDIMFGDNEGKPISIIITTLAAKAYNGETKIHQALNNIIDNMPKFIDQAPPRVSNPVNPEENFADKWSMDEYEHLNLEANFRLWLRQVRVDFDNLLTSGNPKFITKQIKERFSVSLNSDIIQQKLGVKSEDFPEPKEHDIRETVKPWRN